MGRYGDGEGGEFLGAVLLALIVGAGIALRNGMRTITDRCGDLGIVALFPTLLGAVGLLSGLVGREGGVAVLGCLGLAVGGALFAIGRQARKAREREALARLAAKISANAGLPQQTDR